VKGRSDRTFFLVVGLPCKCRHVLVLPRPLSHFVLHTQQSWPDILVLPFFSGPSVFEPPPSAGDEHAIMERYNITYVGGDGHTTRLVVPFRPTAQLADLAAELARRLSKHSVVVDKADLQLRFGDPTGPFLDETDALEDVIINPREETVYVLARSQQAAVADDSSADNTATNIPVSNSSFSFVLTSTNNNVGGCWNIRRHSRRK
jgi:hypothetical protein